MIRQGKQANLTHSDLNKKIKIMMRNSSEKILMLTANVTSLLYREGATISNLSQNIMSPSTEQCEWCNHGNTATETGEGTERMLPEQICTHSLKINK